MTISATAALMIAGVMAMVAVSAMVLAVVLTRRPTIQEEPVDWKGEMSAWRQEATELSALLDQERTAADKAMDEALNTNEDLWRMVVKLAAILRMDPEKDMKRMRDLPEPGDEAWLYDCPIIEDGKLVGVGKTNVAPEAIWHWMYAPDQADKVKELIADRNKAQANNQGGASMEVMQAKATATVEKERQVAARAALDAKAAAEYAKLEAQVVPAPDKIVCEIAASYDGMYEVQLVGYECLRGAGWPPVRSIADGLTLREAMDQATKTDDWRNRLIPANTELDRDLTHVGSKNGLEFYA